ncbi:hypothetical protein [Desulforhopalus singaporensis]|uniref:Uncharacterized protein n=1 Tax=Desulforhopalus singaporensis TaxID=91360 RepID=A0A1H0N5I1_9BACT|nr:hypothetical protein [Desulforhopalus singaporensis]SDO87755.1 hypothetical protein SAMN05660330_01250 [Desulforhopalus singaporensis]
MAATIHKEVMDRSFDSGVINLATLNEKIMGLFWFVLCLGLFVILGPFSGPVAIVALYRISRETGDQPEPQSVN